ncbi:AAA family ATPase [Pseudoluteimonas lycopersici]|uniref:AAA family ATPase n=1 Tax=Pseudoluteimonas lycopersici TaxID=1324796 RepID=A0A516V1S1_9GAMM|nr:ExeA family protein [Lysobacter lycopersici]QDQ72464.1 AAA family ATPase [Lysobacter lycopersici]
MYLEHYGLGEAPYSITPDPRFVFLSERHRDALAHLLFGIGQGGGGGFVQLTGEVGTGKTTLSRLLLEQLPENTRVALLLNPRLGPIELLETVCEELHIDISSARGSGKALVDALNAYLLRAYADGLRVVLIVDEAQNLSADALEQVRLLTNLETDTQKLLQIVLIGQPELRDALAKPELRQLAQRITARFHLTPLSESETGEYLRHRFRVAGGRHFPMTAAAVNRVHKHANGIPRLVNVIAERALLAGYARDASTIDPKLVDAAAREVLPTRNAVGRQLPTAWLLGTAGVLLLGLIAWTIWRPATRTVAAGMPLPQKPTLAVAAKPAIPRLDATALAGAVDAAGASPAPAWEALLGTWTLPASAITVDPASAACTATAADVHCVQGRARLDTLQALDRPLLLRLHGQSGDAWALLLGLDARNARIALSGNTFDIDRLTLQSAWTGEYAGLWRGPDPALPADIAAFQDARGLSADGVAGPETLMALAGDAPGPHLLRVLE